MEINRKQLYRFPWSKTDNPGGWIEVTDVCNLTCHGCYRNQLEGNRPVELVKKDIEDTIGLTNCDCITIAGGEPLIYPELSEVVAHIASLKVKPIIFSNGIGLTPDLLGDLKKAGLAKMHLHVDSRQDRKGWAGNNEQQLNDLRQYYADMIAATGKVQCGFHTTVFRSNLKDIVYILAWGLKNRDRVQHLSFIAYRTIPENETLSFFTDGEQIIPDQRLNRTTDTSEISITTEEMFDVLQKEFPFLHPCAYLNGTTAYETLKFLIMVNFGTRTRTYGHLGRKTMEMAQMGYHLLFNRYFAFSGNPRAGIKIILLSFFDPYVRKGLVQLLKSGVRNPFSIFKPLYLQSIHLQQPNEVIDGKINLCDDCVNMMAYQGKLINSCRLDEYRLYGDALQVISLNHK